MLMFNAKPLEIMDEGSQRIVQHWHKHAAFARGIADVNSMFMESDSAITVAASNGLGAYRIIQDNGRTRVGELISVRQWTCDKNRARLENAV